MKNVFKKAHEITKKIIRKGDSYRETFRLALIVVYSQLKKGVKAMVELKGSEKQVKWAMDLREVVLVACDDAIEAYEKMQQESIIKKGKRVKMRDRQITSIKELKTELENESKASFFINEYSMFLKVDKSERCNRIMTDVYENRASLIK